MCNLPSGPVGGSSWNSACAQLRAGRWQQLEQRMLAAPAPGEDGDYAVVDDWWGKMAAPEEPELSQAQTEKLLQFQVDNPSFKRMPVRLKPNVWAC